MEWIKVLEWVAFLSAMFTVFLYGHTKFYGAIAGIITGFLFVTWGTLAEIYAAALINIVFIPLHARNLWIAIKEKHAR